MPLMAVDPDRLMALQEEAAKLKHPYVKGFLKCVRKLQLAKKPVRAETMANASNEPIQDC